MQWQKPKGTAAHMNANVHGLQCLEVRQSKEYAQLEMVSNKCVLVPFINHIISCFWNQL